jgi:hypothetical protein
MTGGGEGRESGMETGGGGFREAVPGLGNALKYCVSETVDGMRSRMSLPRAARYEHASSFEVVWHCGSLGGDLALDDLFPKSGC